MWLFYVLQALHLTTLLRKQALYLTACHTIIIEIQHRCVIWPNCGLGCHIRSSLSFIQIWNRSTVFSPISFSPHLFKPLSTPTVDVRPLASQKVLLAYLCFLYSFDTWKQECIFILLKLDSVYTPSIINAVEWNRAKM